MEPGHGMNWDTLPHLIYHISHIETLDKMGDLVPPGREPGSLDPKERIIYYSLKCLAMCGSGNFLLHYCISAIICIKFLYHKLHTMRCHPYKLESQFPPEKVIMVMEAVNILFTLSESIMTAVYTREGNKHLRATFCIKGAPNLWGGSAKPPGKNFGKSLQTPPPIKSCPMLPYSLIKWHLTPEGGARGGALPLTAVRGH